MKKVLTYSITVVLAFCLGCGRGEKDYYAEAVKAAQAGKYEKAVELFKRSLKERPGNARAHNYLGMIYMRMGDQSAAQKEFGQAINVDPSFGIAFYNLGRVCEEKGLIDEAQQKYKRAVDLSPALVQAHNSLGVVSARLGKHEEAVEAFERTLSIQPEFKDARFNLGVVYATKLDDNEKAKKHLKAYLKVAPVGDKAQQAQKLLRELGEKSSAEFYNNGMELVSGGHFEKALNQFEKALANDPKFAPAMLETAKIYDFQLEDKEEAVRYYEKYLEANLKADDAPEVMSFLAEARKKLKPSPTEVEKEREAPQAPSPIPPSAKVVTESWEKHREKALNLQQASEHSAAIEEFKKAMELNPDLDVSEELGRAYFKLGIEQMNKENYEDAVASFQKSLSLVPSSGEVEYELGRAYAARGNYEKALSNFKRASSHGISRIGKDLAGVYASLGEEHLKAGRYGEAVKCYKEALERNPSNAELHLKMARLLRRGENYTRALAEYREALDLDPNYAEAHSEVAKLLETNLNDQEEALRHYKRYLQVAPSGPSASNAKAAVEKLTEEVDKLRKQREMVKKYPLRAETHYNLAVVLQERGLLDEAIAEYKKTIQLKPDFDRAYFNLGAVYMKRGYYNRAIQMYQKATQLNPNYTKAYNNLGVLYSKRGRYENAISSYEKALMANPGFASAHFNIALLYKNLGKKGKALYHYRKYIEYAPNGEYADEVREVIMRLGRQER